MDDLVNPNKNNQNPKFNWDVRFQQEILGMLLNDRMFLIQTFGLLKPQYFLTNSHELICTCLFSYFKSYSEIPSEFILSELIREKVEDQSLRVRYLADLQYCSNAYVPGASSRDFNVKKITQFAKEQALREAISKSMELIYKREDDSRWNKIEDIFRQALAVDISYDVGLEYFTTIDERYERMRNQIKCNEVFVTGFDEIDAKISHGGLKRGEIGAYLGLPGVGKSNFLCKAAVTNLKRNKKVLYVSLELNQDKLGARIDSILAGMDMRNIPDPPDGQILIPEQMGRSTEDIIKNYIQSNFPNKDKHLMLKQFPAGTLTISSLRAYLSQIAFRGFKPDMMILDYVGEMKDYEGLKTYESRQLIVRDLRGIAVEENICVFTALQANRSGREQQKENYIDDSALGDSFGQARPLDALWSINHDDNDKKFGVGRLYIVKHRDGESRKMTYFKQDNLDANSISEESYCAIRSRGKEDHAINTNLPKFKPKKENDDDDSPPPPFAYGG